MQLLLGTLVSALFVILAGQPATTAPAEKTVSSQAMRVKFTVPAKWTPEEVELQKIGKNPPSVTLTFNEVAETDAVLALVRQDEKLSGEEAAKRIETAIKEMRDSFKAGDFKTLADEEIKVAGQAGRAIEGEGELGGQVFYNRVVVFALDGYLYRLNVNGKKADCDKHKAAIQRMIATMQPLR